ncbi:MAG: hypothetical protein WBB43_06105 [Limnoraphis sp.]
MSLTPLECYQRATQSLEETKKVFHAKIAEVEKLKSDLINKLSEVEELKSTIQSNSEALDNLKKSMDEVNQKITSSSDKKNQDTDHQEKKTASPTNDDLFSNF